KGDISHNPGRVLYFHLANHYSKLALFADLPPELARSFAAAAPDETRVLKEFVTKLMPAYYLAFEERSVHYAENSIDLPDSLAGDPERKLLDFGIGENDDLAAAVVRETLKREVDKVENRGYADNGIQNYKDAAAEFMFRQFGVKLDPVTEVCHCIGSKPAYAMLPACFINPGDITLMTVPGYPVAGTHTRYYGGGVHKLPLVEKNGLLPAL